MPYNTNTEADAYFAARYGYDKWDPLTEPAKTQALTSAQQELDLQCYWFGTPTDPDQGVAFPRNGEATVPDDIKAAECEIAYNIVNQGSTSTESGDPLEELKAGSVTLKFKASSSSSNPLINDNTSKILSQYGVCGGSGSTKVVPIMRQ